MRIFEHCSVFLTIACVAQSYHQHFHQKAERGAPWQTTTWNCSESKIWKSSPSSPLPLYYQQDVSSGCRLATFDPPKCDAVQSAPAHIDLTRATYTKPNTTDSPSPVSSSASDVIVILNQNATALSSAMATGLTTSSTPQGSVPGNLTTGKRGLAYNSASLTILFSGKDITWVYNWDSVSNGTTLEGAEYVAMLWGDKSTDTWFASAAAAIASGTTHVLSFNEPDHPKQANMDPALAAQKHIEYLNPLSAQVSIGSPAITNGGSPMGIEWLENFFEACGGQCKVNFVVCHWYDAASNFAYFKEHVEQVISFALDKGIEKVWVTEFGASGTDEEVATFLRQALDYLDGNSAVERYAYFMCSDGILVNAGAISDPIGKEYVS